MAQKDRRGRRAEARFALSKIEDSACVDTRVPIRALGISTKAVQVRKIPFTISVREGDDRLGFTARRDFDKN